MSNLVKLCIGVAALLVLWLVTNFFKHDPIEEDLRAASQAALNAEYPWAEVTINGRNAVISGAAPSGQMAEAARDVVASLHGVHSARVDFDGLDTVSPFLMVADFTGETLRLSGVAPSQNAIDSIVLNAQSRFPNSNIVNELRIASGAPTGDWEGAANMGIDQLRDLKNGTARLRDLQLSLEGTADRADTVTEIEKSLADLPNGFSGSQAINVAVRDAAPRPPKRPAASPPKVTVPEKVKAEIDKCQRRINEVMTGKKINFKTGSAEVVPQPNPLIKKLGRIARDCPSARIVISGHTDSTGDAAANQSLSEARAIAVADLLVKQRVPASRLVARGFGQMSPIADNSVPEGRALNRRIEFKVTYAGP